MSRTLVLALFISLLLHGGVALSSYLYKGPAEAPPPAEEIPTIALDMPPPPEPEEPEILELEALDTPSGDVADLAPPMQQDVPTATIDSPFVQRLQPAPPPGLDRPSGGIVIPTATRPAVQVGASLGNLFDLNALDRKPTPTFQGRPQYPFDLKRSGIEGEVLVSFIVDASGGVRDPYIVRSSNPGFDAAVLTAVSKWRFRPGQKAGANVNTRNVQILIPFTLAAER